MMALSSATTRKWAKEEMHRLEQCQPSSVRLDDDFRSDLNPQKSVCALSSDKNRCAFRRLLP